MNVHRPPHIALGTDHRHHDTDRLLSAGELESLLAWWRTTAKDRYGVPLFCSHGRHTGGRCDECPADRPTRCRRG